MARINLIKDPSKFLFTTKIQVRINDINYGNHVGNDAFVNMLQEVRIQWLQQFNLTELNLGIANVGMIQTTLSVQYLKEAFYGDLLIFKLYVQELTAKHFEFYYECLKLIDNKEEICLLATTQMLSYNYELKKIITIPEQLLIQF